jgi:hypothetical protein
MARYKKGGLCTSCFRVQQRKDNPDLARRHREASERWNAKYPERRSKYLKAKHRKDPRLAMIQNAKNRAKKLGIRFFLSVDDLDVPAFCPLLNIPIFVGDVRGDNSPSLDRIVPEKGYVSGNVWVISDLANRIKQNATPDQIEQVAINLRKRLNQ